MKKLTEILIVAVLLSLVFFFFGGQPSLVGITTVKTAFLNVSLMLAGLVIMSAVTVALRG